MANEITLTAGLAHNQGGTSVNGQVTKGITQTGTKRIANTQAIQTASEALLFGDVTPTKAYIKNLDGTNFVYIGNITPCTALNAFAKLLPGEANVYSLNLGVLYALADTGTVNIEVIATEA